MDQPSSPRISRPLPADERQAENRRRLREFLRAIPRAEPESELELLGPADGTPTRVISRARLTEAIDKFGPRTRQIIHLTLEEGWTREETQDYLHTSLRTLERHQAAALDRLANLAK